MRPVLLDVFLLQLSVTKSRPDAEIDAARRILDRKAFQRRLLRAARAVFRGHAELAGITRTLTR